MKNLSLILITALLITACSNTFRGMGDDMQDWGKAISGAAGSSSSAQKQPATHTPVNNDINSDSTRY